MMPANMQVMLGKGNVIMILRHTGLSATCQTVARVDSLARADEVRSGISTKLGAKPAEDYKGDEAFKAFIARTAPGGLENLMISDAARFTVLGKASDASNIVSTIMVPRILD